MGDKKKSGKVDFIDVIILLIGAVMIIVGSINVAPGSIVAGVVVAVVGILCIYRSIKPKPEQKKEVWDWDSDDAAKEGAGRGDADATEGVIADKAGTMKEMDTDAPVEDMTASSCKEDPASAQGTDNQDR